MCNQEQYMIHKFIVPGVKQYPFFYYSELFASRWDCQQGLVVLIIEHALDGINIHSA